MEKELKALSEYKVIKTRRMNRLYKRYFCQRPYELLSDNEKNKRDEFYALTSRFLKENKPTRYSYKITYDKHSSNREARPFFVQHDVIGPIGYTIDYLDNFGYYYGQYRFAKDDSDEFYVTPLGDNPEEALFKFMAKILQDEFIFDPEYRKKHDFLEADIREFNQIIKDFADYMMIIWKDFKGYIRDEVINWFNDYLSYGFNKYLDSDKFEISFGYHDGESDIIIISKKKNKRKERTSK